MKIRYWTNAGTRYCSMTNGPIDESEMKRDGYAEVYSEAEMEEFRAITKKAKEAGWTGSSRTLKKFIVDGVNIK